MSSPQRVLIPRDFIRIDQCYYRYDLETVTWVKYTFQRRPGGVRDVTNEVYSKSRIIFRNNGLMLDMDNLCVRKYTREDYVTIVGNIIYHPLSEELITKWEKVNVLLKKIMSKTMYKNLFELVQCLLSGTREKKYIIINSCSLQIYNLIKGIFQDLYDELILTDVDKTGTIEIGRQSAPLTRSLFKVGEITSKMELVYYHQSFQTEDMTLILYNHMLHNIDRKHFKLLPECQFIEMKRKAAVIVYNIEEIRDIMISIIINMY